MAKKKKKKRMLVESSEEAVDHVLEELTIYKTAGYCVFHIAKGHTAGLMLPWDQRTNR